MDSSESVAFAFRAKSPLFFVGLPGFLGGPESRVKIPRSAGVARGRRHHRRAGRRPPVRGRRSRRRRGGAAL